MIMFRLIKKLFPLVLIIVGSAVSAATLPPTKPPLVLQSPRQPADRMALDKGVPQAALDRLRQGKPQSLIVEFDAAPVDTAAKKQQVTQGMKADNPFIVNFKVTQYADMKRRALAVLTPTDYKTETDYSHLPMAFIRLNSMKALDTLLAQPDVVRV